MDKLVINGGRKLFGTVRVQGAKNAVLPLMAAAVLTEDRVNIGNCPNLSDVRNMSRILTSLGAETSYADGELAVNPKGVKSHEIPSKLAKELRSSIFLLGSVLGRMKEAKVAYPGGCDIGLRPIDIHIKGLKELNVRITEEYGYIYCDAKNIKAGSVNLDYPSVGATENFMLAAALLDGITLIHNAAREPEIVDLQNFLNSMGAEISGAGTGVIKVRGVERLHGTDYQTMPDRIVAGTVLAAVAACGGEVRLEKADPEHLTALISKLRKTGCNISCKSDIINISSDGRLKAVQNVDTQPYPGFPTDLQAQMAAVLTLARGTSLVTENIFETRFKHVPELTKMGADITVKGRTAVISGVQELKGAEVAAEDLRGGAALVIAGLAAKGITVINNVQYIDRGYESIENLFGSIGGDITRL